MAYPSGKHNTNSNEWPVRHRGQLCCRRQPDSALCHGGGDADSKTTANPCLGRNGWSRIHQRRPSLHLGLGGFMPTVSFNFTTAQLARVQEATDLYNAQTGETLTPKQFVFLVCVRQEVRRLLREKSALDAVNSATTSIDTDLGDTIA